jgi:hypothetical protein
MINDVLKKNSKEYQDWMNQNSGNTGQQVTSAIVPITADSAWRQANNASNGPDNSLRNPLNSFLLTTNPPKTPTATDQQQQKPSGGTRTYTVNAGNQPYVDQLNSLYDQIVNRKPFQYDLNGDLLYREVADRYTQQGQQAMRDTMGQAAALTGGYGNSYANQVGNQAYQQYLTALNDNIPKLWDRAYKAYLNEGDQLMQKYKLTAAHPGYVEALSPRTYTVKVPEDEKKDDPPAGDQSAYNLAPISAGLLPAEGAQAPNTVYNYDDYLINASDRLYK